MASNRDNNENPSQEQDGKRTDPDEKVDTVWRFYENELPEVR